MRVKTELYISFILFIWRISSPFFHLLRKKITKTNLFKEFLITLAYYKLSQNVQVYVFRIIWIILKYDKSKKIIAFSWNILKITK